MKEKTECHNYPIFFERNRVFRLFMGGSLFHDFFGDEEVDSHFPEEWVASCVKSKLRTDCYPQEGLSKIENSDTYFIDLLELYKDAMLGPGGNFNVLVKVLDSAIRLTIQAHPDREFSEKYFDSSFGKAEAWLALETREDACVYFGFNKKITKEQFSELVEQAKSDPNLLESYMNRVKVQPGDMFFVPAKMPHAIGSGCLIVEIQEPTDFTLSPEYWCGKHEMNDYQRYRGLEKEIALNCFDYSIYGEAAIAKGKKYPKTVFLSNEYTKEVLIGPQDTSCFALNQYTVDGGALPLECGPAVYIVTNGTGTLESSGFTRSIHKGDYFFLPYCVTDAQIKTNSKLNIVECLPPKH